MSAADVMQLFTGQGTCQPHIAKVKCGIQTGLFAFLDDSVSALGRRIGKLQLDGNTSCDINIVDLLGFLDLQQNDVLIRHAAVVDHIAHTAKGMILVNEPLARCVFHFRHDNTLSIL